MPQGSPVQWRLPKHSALRVGTWHRRKRQLLRIKWRWTARRAAEAQTPSANNQRTPCKAAGEEPQIGDKHPGGGAGDTRFEVVGEPATAPEPGQAALHHPSPRQQLAPLDAGWALDDLDPPRAALGD